jgi:hypothetical protein
MSAILKVSNPVEVKRKGYQLYDRPILLSERRIPSFNNINDISKQLRIRTHILQSICDHSLTTWRCWFIGRRRRRSLP